MGHGRNSTVIPVRLPDIIANRLKEMAYYNHLNITDFLKPFFYDIAGMIPDHDNIIKHQYANMKKGREFYLKMRNSGTAFFITPQGIITEDFKTETEKEYQARYYKEHRGKLAKHPRQDAPQSTTDGLTA